MTLDWLVVFIFFIVGFGFILALMTAGAFVRPHAPTPAKQMSYECGIDPIGPPWIQFNIRFYTIALIFLVFDVEIALLYPCAVLAQERAGLTFLEILVFVGILMIGFIYLWAKGDLEWVKAAQSGSVEPSRTSEPADRVKSGKE